ncbi:hypothetical protein [Mesotoga sp.]|uniref:InlB B-repeat-containing protein n=1 Tax=Mesotoga sp. TaxID=2053577 RepID=UPI00345EEF40
MLYPVEENYYHGENVTLNAAPNEGYEFLTWAEGGIEVRTEEEYSLNRWQKDCLQPIFL